MPRFRSSPVGPGDVGKRVTVRFRLPDGRATDVIGILERLDQASATVLRASGETVEIPLDALVAARVVPPPGNTPGAGPPGD